MTRRVPAETAPPDPLLDRPRLHQPSTAYHEAGHAVLLWHYGIHFRYVTLRPRNPGHAGHVYTGRRRNLDGLADLEKEMHVCAAGQLAQDWIFRMNRTSPSDSDILNRLARAADHPDSPWLDDDTRNFVLMGAELDAVALAADSAVAAGAAGWLRIWREAETLVHGELWPAVYAVAWEMVVSSRALTFADIAEIAAAAIAASGPAATRSADSKS